MTHRWFAKVAGIVMGVAGIAGGEVATTTTRPSTQPATAGLWVDKPPVPASELPELTATVQQLLDALADGDEATVANLSLLPFPISRDESLGYARRLILSSRLDWLLVDRFGEKRARSILAPARLEHVAWIDPEEMTWQSLRLQPRATSTGATEKMLGHGPGLDARYLIMYRTPQGWKLNRETEMPALVMLDLDDVQWRCKVLTHVLQGIHSDRLQTPRQITDALLPHAPATRPTTKPFDRSTPEGALATLFAALDAGDAKGVADSLQYPRQEQSSAKNRRVFAERLVADRALVKALEVKFEPEQSARIIRESSLAPKFLERYTQAAWAVDGDVARAVFPQPYYNIGMRMIRRDRVWRICWMPPTDDDQNRELARTKREQAVLRDLDKYSTPGAVLRALNETVAEQPGREQSLKTLRQQLADAERAAATQPARSADEQFHRELGMLYGHLAEALLSENPQEAAKHYYAAGDDGSYCVARERRALAAHDLLDAAGAEIGAGPSVTLLNSSDDLYGLIMIDWKVTADVAKPNGATGGSPILRKIDGMWRIDVTCETNADPKEAAREVEDDARKIAALTARVKKGEFKSAETFHQAVEAMEIKGFSSHR